MEPAYVYRASCTRVIDGDTFVLVLDLGFRVGVEIHGRLHGVDAPELPTSEGRAAKVFAMAVLPPSAALVVRSWGGEQSFARWVVDVWLPDGALLADVLVAAGHARRI